MESEPRRVLQHGDRSWRVGGSPLVLKRIKPSALPQKSPAISHHVEQLSSPATIADGTAESHFQDCIGEMMRKRAERHAQILLLAIELADNRGAIHGYSIRDWCRAEEEVDRQHEHGNC